MRLVTMTRDVNKRPAGGWILAPRVHPHRGLVPVTLLSGLGPQRPAWPRPVPSRPRTLTTSPTSSTVRCSRDRSTHPQLGRHTRAPGAPRAPGRRARQPAGSRGSCPATPWRTLPSEARLELGCCWAPPQALGVERRPDPFLVLPPSRSRVISDSPEQEFA